MSKSVLVGLMVDLNTLLVVPTVSAITATTERERDAIARAAIKDYAL